MHYDSSMYEKSIASFNRIKLSEYFKGEDYFKLSICFSKVHMLDSSLMYLDSALHYGFKLEDSLMIEKSKTLTQYFSYPNFKSRINMLISNRTIVISDSSLIKIFQEVRLNDQKYRGGLLDSISWKLQEKLDIENQRIVKDFILKNGWPRTSTYGEIAYICWLVVQHADYDLDFQKRCLQMMQKNLRYGEIRLGDYAYLYDRVMLNDCKEQLYGSQFWILRDEKGKLKSIEFKPIKDSELVDRRRRYMNIPSLERYREIARERYMNR
jgi:hypothetical protein